MPVTIPRSVGQIPAYYYHKPTAKRGYAFASSAPLYAFGYGLSYTDFDISDPILENPEIAPDGSTYVTVNVTNTGDISGDEIVQLYIRDKISTVTRPVMELKGFKRISLDPGETQKVKLPITRASLQFYNRDMQRVVEPGEFEIMVGTSSQSHKSTTLIVKQ
jgi:beta-glucosidase